ncbi:MAG: hypothetical protein RL536_290, partial [Candidatus Parcubacteria bacterium]
AVTDKEVGVFVASPELANYFESVISTFQNDTKKVRLAINYLLTDYLKFVNDSGKTVDVVKSSAFAELIDMISGGEISSRAAKDILGLLFNESGSSAKELAVKHSLIQKSDASDLIPAIEKVLTDNPKAVSEYKAGKIASLQFLVGQSMKATKGAGNPEVVKKLLLERLS